MSPERLQTGKTSPGRSGMAFPGEDLLADDPIAQQSYRERLSAGASGPRVRWRA